MVTFPPVRALISVVMPAYNSEKYIASALESVWSEGAEGIEVVVVDDGSSDRTVEIVQEFSKKIHVRLIRPGWIGNWVGKTNVGLREATGEWACFLPTDDLWLPGRMTRLRGEMEKAKGLLVVHDAKFVGPEGQALGPWTCPFREGNIPADQFVERLLVQNFIAAASPLFMRRAVVESGGLDEKLWFTADWDLWLRLGSLGPVRFVPEILSAFRIHPASETVTHPVRPGEWEEQLTTVFLRHFTRWNATKKRRAKVERAAMASVAINATLAAASRGQPLQWKGPLWKLLALGPLGWRRYLRDSRIVQRVGARLKLRRSLIGSSHRSAVSTPR